VELLTVNLRALVSIGSEGITDFALLGHFD
jgi:hypothetical protein